MVVEHKDLSEISTGKRSFNEGMESWDQYGYSTPTRNHNVLQSHVMYA